MPDARDVDALHHPWLLPFELVDTRPEGVEAAWAVIQEDGNLLRPSGPFAPAIVARVHGGEHVLPTEEWARAAATEFLAQQYEQEAAWLLRIQRNPSGDPTCLVLRGPEAVQARPARDHGVALLMDFGRVLCHFDYSWFVWGHTAVFGHEPGPDAIIEIETMRPAFEAGDIPEEEFFHHCARHLGLLEADRRLFDAAWANILRLHDDMHALLRHAFAQPGWTGIIVSNIDPILVRETVQRFDLGEIFADGVYSYQSEVRPKHEDASMWRLARARCAQRFEGEPALVIATDDTPANLLTAAAEPGVDATIQFHNPWQWQYELGAHGAYLPRQRDCAKP